MNYKNPNSILVVVYDKNSHLVLMLQREDDPDFWQSVTGTIEQNETPWQTAVREVREEIGVDILAQNLPLFDCQTKIEFEIFPHFRYKYAPNITHCVEHWFLLPFENEFEPVLSEHLSYRWVLVEEAVEMTKSPSNAQVITEYLIK